LRPRHTERKIGTVTLALTHFEHSAAIVRALMHDPDVGAGFATKAETRLRGDHARTIRRGTTMADRSALKVVGFIFATVTLAVMLTAAMVVKGYADGTSRLDVASIESQQ
jgi:hypothetical protein